MKKLSIIIINIYPIVYLTLKQKSNFMGIQRNTLTFVSLYITTTQCAGIRRKKFHSIIVGTCVCMFAPSFRSYDNTIIITRCFGS